MLGKVIQVFGIGDNLKVYLFNIIQTVLRNKCFVVDVRRGGVRVGSYDTE